MKECGVRGFIGDVCRKDTSVPQEESCFLLIDVENHRANGWDTAPLLPTIRACTGCPFQGLAESMASANER